MASGMQYYIYLSPIIFHPAVQERSSTLKNEERNGIPEQTDHDDINEPSFDHTGGQDTVPNELHLDLYPAITDGRETAV